MKTGNVTGNVYKRSVHRKIETNGIGVKGAEYGEGCAFLTSENVDKAPEKRSSCGLRRRVCLFGLEQREPNFAFMRQ